MHLRCDFPADARRGRSFAKLDAAVGLTLDGTGPGLSGDALELGKSQEGGMYARGLSS